MPGRPGTVAGRPPDGAIRDVHLLGVGGDPFGSDARIAFGKAIGAAESEQGDGRLSLLRWRDGQTESIVIRLPVLGAYGPSAPYDCRKSRAIFDRGCEAIAARGLKGVSIPNSLNALALLASGEDRYRPLLSAYAREAAELRLESMATTTKNLTTAQGKIGTSTVDGVKQKFFQDKLNRWMGRKLANKLTKMFATADVASPGKLKRLSNSASSLVSDVKSGKYGSWLQSDDGRSAEKFEKFGFSIAVGSVTHTTTSTTTVGSTAVLWAGADAVVRADTIDRPQAIANAEVNNGRAPPERAYAQTQKKFSGGVAVVVANYTSTAITRVDTGASIDAGMQSTGSVTVEARTFLPYDFPLERYLSLADFFSKAASVLKAVTTWSKAKATAKEGAGTGSVSLLTLAPSATTIISSGANINQSARTTQPGSVVVRAETESQLVNLIDNPFKLLDLRASKQTAKPSGGGAFSAVYYAAKTTAVVDSGAAKGQSQPIIVHSKNAQKDKDKDKSKTSAA